MLKMTKGKKYFFISRHKAYEVIRECSSGYYLVLFDASCSDIQYVSKSQLNEHNVKKAWFENKEDMLNQRIKNAEKELEVSKNSLGRYHSQLEAQS